MNASFLLNFLFDDATGAPTLHPSSTITLADDASPTPPAFVPDTGEVAYVPSCESAASATVRRVAIPIDRR